MANVEIDGANSIVYTDKLDPKTGTALEIGTSGDTITIPSGATITNSGTATGFGGVGSADQSWSDVTGSRALGSTYTNSTGQPIQVVVSVTMDDGEVLEFRIGGVAMGSQYMLGGSPRRGMSAFIVPDGDTYAAVNTSGGSTLVLWAELS